nr:MAG TPA: hypothetical protein [Caudoviricetes sp.]
MDGDSKLALLKPAHNYESIVGLHSGHDCHRVRSKVQCFLSYAAIARHRR